jgi:WD40 repeat protein/tRNA A-37 threonylcarbamoyl transferase component Bud32
MSERSIFLDALDREDPAARAAYLDEACAGRPELRQRIERLLQSHEAKDSFLEVPAPEQCARAEQSLAFLSPPREPGTLGWLDHYDVLEVVGRGATGVVLKARDTKLQRIVALKVLAPRLAASRTARERFVREAQATAAVRDDHVIAIYAVSDDGPLPYLVMEYIAGVTLEQRIKQGGSLQLREILRIGLQVASGLAAAHAQGLIHRDIKPGNILLENGVQRVKITDFGLAVATAEADGTQHGVLAGTPPLMAPSQARGEPTSERSDLFSLGAVLYTLCTGRPPFTGATTAAVLKSVCEDTPEPIRAIRAEIPEGLCDLIGKLLAKDPADCFASAREVAELLSSQLAVVQQPPPPTAAVVKVEPMRAAGPARRWLPGGTLALILGLVLLLCGLAALVAVLKPWPEKAPDAGPTSTPPHKARPVAGPFDLRREAIPQSLLALAGGGDPANAPRELAAVLGDGRFLLPWIGNTTCMEQSPDGQLLAVTRDEDVVLFEAHTGKLLQILKGPGSRVTLVTFSGDSRLLAASTSELGKAVALRVWDMEGRRELFTKALQGPRVYSAAFSPDGKRLLTDSPPGLQVWNARSGQQLQQVEIRPAYVASLCFSPDGRRLAAAAWNAGSVIIFGWNGENLDLIRTLENEKLVGTVMYSPDGKFLASGDQAGFKIWNAETWKVIRAVATPAQQLAFAPDSRTLIAAWTVGPPSAVHTFTRWDVVKGQELSPLVVEVSPNREYAIFCLGRDGKSLFVAPAGKATNVRAFETATGKELFPRQGHMAPLNAVAINPDGRTLASAGEDRTVKVWDLPTGRVVHTLTAHTEEVFGLAFSRDGNLLASGSLDGTIVLWDVDRGAEVRRFKGHSHSYSRIWFSPDGRTLAAGSEVGTVKRWDVGSGKEDKALPGHAGSVRCVAFSPDGTQLASGGEDMTVRLHDLAAGTSRKLVVPSIVNEVAFSPNGRILAAVGGAPKPGVQLWDLETGQQMNLEGHTAVVRGLAFAPREPLLATCAEDSIVRLWELMRGQAPVRTIDLGKWPSGVRAVAFTPDGRFLVTANGNGTVYALRVGTPH